ncbi:hypothetical protein [Aminobacter niigataensis]|uniref:hypothetical protein n=1 Tax=Aminobacter niigataensis TaxID=83265 RepID=UPI002284627C|nr:hypothetical protein [Aminobacter niigataensis]CAI2936815.1 protein of unknown function [Aminobacter niigataensis]
MNHDRAKPARVFAGVQLDEHAVSNIKAKFLPLLGRDIMGVADELEQKDRQDFDDAVLSAFGLDIPREHIYGSLRGLVEIRLTAND